MIETRHTLIHKIPVLVLTMLFALYLVRVSLALASADASTPEGVGYMYPVDNFKIAIHNVGTVAGTFSGITTRTIHGSLHSVSKAPGHVANFAVSVADIPAFIKPAEAENKPVPVITPLHFSPVQTVPAPTTPPAVATIPAPAPSIPASPVRAAASVANQVSPTNNLYAWGNCTWWAAIRRSQIGDSVPNSWGNAASWALRAAADGYAVDHTPSPGAIMQNSSMAGGLGHVAFVESVAPDGSWRISEMNVLGLDKVDYATQPGSAAMYYNFIHDKP